MNPFYDDGQAILLHGEVSAVLKTLPDCSVHCVITSPPYWGLRDYGNPDQIGQEPSPDEFVSRLVDVFREVRRVLRDDGTLWLNLGDSYATDRKGSESRSALQLSNAGSFHKVSHRLNHGLKQKDLVGIPWRVAFALQADGWYLRSDIIWSKPNPMPESVTDRPTKAHEYLFLLSKFHRYYYDADAIAEKAKYGGDVVTLGSKSLSKGQATGSGMTPSGNGNAQSVVVAEKRNRRTVWEINTEPYTEAHFATFPPSLIRPCVLAGSPVGGVVLDPFIGSGTTAQVAKDLGRKAIGIDLNADYLQLAVKRCSQMGMALQEGGK